MIGTALVCILLSLILYGYIALRKNRHYFKEKNIKYLEPNIFFGNSTDVLLGRMHQTESMNRLYKAFPEEELVGLFEFQKPVFLVRSPEVVTAILVRDFSHFHDRMERSSVIEDASDANLFILPGNIWKAIRQRFSPLFSSGKLKYMYGSMADCGQTLCAHLDQIDGQEVDMVELMKLFAMDVIGSTAFGIDSNVQRNPDSEFVKQGNKLLDNSIKAAVRGLINLFFPKLAKIFKMKGFADEGALQYFCDVITSSMEQRKKGGTERNDFVQMLLVLKEKGRVDIQVHDPGDDYLMMDKTPDTYEVQMTDDILVGGAFTFLLAGFHATAMALSFALLELSQRPDVVERLRAEVDAQAAGRQLTYQQLGTLNYLEMAIKEALRIYPPAPILSRVCTKEYTFQNGLKVKPGQQFMIPTRSIHMDPANWPEPEVFRPERFQEEPRPGTFLPFGDGPRICLAMRFAMMEMKFALAELLRRYDIELSDKTRLPVKIQRRVFLLSPDGGITFNVRKRKV